MKLLLYFENGYYFSSSHRTITDACDGDNTILSPDICLHLPMDKLDAGNSNFYRVKDLQRRTTLSKVLGTDKTNVYETWIKYIREEMKEVTINEVRIL